MHYRGGVHFENLTEVKLRDILLTGTSAEICYSEADFSRKKKLKN